MKAIKEAIGVFELRADLNYGLCPADKVALIVLREKLEREKGCVWCKESNKVFHDGQHFHLFCSYCGKRLEVKHDS